MQHRSPDQFAHATTPRPLARCGIVIREMRPARLDLVHTVPMTPIFFLPVLSKKIQSNIHDDEPMPAPKDRLLRSARRAL